MANSCYFEMLVQGSPGKVDEFVSLFARKRPPFRIDYAEISHEEESWKEKKVIISGDCAWSVYRSFRETDISLQSESERLGIGIDVFSEEEGFCFQEHYTVVKGKELVDKCVDWERKVDGNRIVEVGGLVWEHTDMSEALKAQ